jgi:hypothetical protein
MRFVSIKPRDWSVSLGARGPVAVSDRLPGGADFDVETVERIGLTATARECDSNGRGLAVKPTRMTNPARPAVTHRGWG